MYFFYDARDSEFAGTNARMQVLSLVRQPLFQTEKEMKQLPNNASAVG